MAKELIECKLTGTVDFGQVGLRVSEAPSRTRAYLYIKSVGDETTPFITGKINGHEHLHKKSTKIHSGDSWWDQVFRFRVKDNEADYVTIELRQKGEHLVMSDWIGEVLLRARNFRDGNVHENWFPLGEGTIKRHTRLARGYIHLMVHLVNRGTQPFQTPSVEGNLTFEDWQHRGQPAEALQHEVSRAEYGNISSLDDYPMVPAPAVPAAIPSNGSYSMFGVVQPPSLTSSDSSCDFGEHRTFELTYPNIGEAEFSINRNAWKILMTEKPSQAELVQMKKYNRVNCLHKGAFDRCSGKRYMVCVDGTESSREAFHSTIALMDKVKDHLFIITVRERVNPTDFYNEESQVFITHKLWRAAAGILSQYQEVCLAEGIDYTTIMPVAEDAREMVVALSKKFKADIIVIGKHKPSEKAPGRSRYFRSFQRYCQGHAKCSVMTFGQY
ncbi:hypothetical protein PROFUN_14071 [Planoprotostelium fungivorum]|uniref:C2 domain-containing protein n=1 Tax=Planoprotostelium fungivorum TaxID=1890364 RepID=A0A2P6N1Y4_9EUKA|nr:hypothetical protein PROFUN_14071 [Planoprotostelium fungivorum]